MTKHLTGAPPLPPAFLMIELNHVSLHYPRMGVALQDISLTIEQGAFVALVGASGCGKSSLLRLIAGLMHPTSGTLNHIPQNIGFVFQEATLMAWHSAYHNIALPLKLAGMTKKEIDYRVDEALTLVGLRAHRHALPRELSGGMKMRVSLARALVSRPDLLLLDEPFAALDELTRHRLEDDLLAIWRETKCTMIFVTHSISESAYLAERVVVLTPAPGRLAATIAIPKPQTQSAIFRTTPEFLSACDKIGAALRNREAAL